MINNIRNYPVFRPLSWLYGGVTDVRNYLYQLGIFTVTSPQVPSVTIGNLTVGGTGKTPMTAYLVELLADQYQIAVLSRGYGRKTKGFVYGDARTTVEQLGDEPFQYLSKFGTRIKVVVCEDRVAGSEEILRRFPDTDLILLDDAFQHRAIRSSVQILLSDYHRPFYLDHPFPSGNLRERKKGAQRADVVVVTKAPPQLSEEEKRAIVRDVSVYTKPNTPVFFASIKYGMPVPYAPHDKLNPAQDIAGVSAIAQNAQFEAYLEEHFKAKTHLSYPDHHFFTASDFAQIMTYLKKGYQVLTTEKDMVKLKPLAAQHGITSGLFYVPIATDFGNETARFNAWVHSRISKPSAL